eukprot:gene1227-2382_t
MGLLKRGIPLTWEDALKHLDYVREHGILQFLHTWNRVKDVHGDELRWGDEIECGILVVDPDLKTVKVVLRGADLRQQLQDNEEKVSHQTEGCVWQPEFGAWMIESTPNRPYSNYATDLLRVERNMILRRRRLLASLQSNEIAPTVTCFPLLGVNNFIASDLDFEAPYSDSAFIPDWAINPHPRYATLANNIRSRRGSKVKILVPLYKDLYTPEFLDKSVIESLSESLNAKGVQLEPDTNINMDCMAFGMGMCCLQVTLQARDVTESRYLYDQLAILAPIMLAMTAGTPIFKGRLSDIDCRWTVIAQSVDDRTPAERGEVPEAGLSAVTEQLREYAGHGVRRQHKSRYDSISTYIYHCQKSSDCERTFAVYNDVPCPIDESMKEKLLQNGVDANLAHHLAHLFTRDPLVIFDGEVEVDDASTTDHFENIQSTNWQTVRWKPPPIRLSPDDPYIGWRTEFRSMEVQITDFENAAFAVFTALISRVILSFDLALYIPLSKVDENMRRAHSRDAVKTEKFFFREFMAPPDPQERGTAAANAEWMGHYANEDCSNCGPWRQFLTPNDGFEEMTLAEIFNGKGDYFPGLIPLVYTYLDYIECDPETFHRVDEYLKFISSRAKGDLLTPAQWMRKFVTSHPAYKHDSIVSQEIAHDLMMACKNIGEGAIPCPELLGPIRIQRVRSGDAYGTELAGRLNSADRSALLMRLMKRGNDLRVQQRQASIGDEPPPIPLLYRSKSVGL